MAGLVIGMTVTLHAKLGRNCGRHSSAGHAASDEGERDEQSYEPSPQGLHHQDATILLRTGQFRYLAARQSRSACLDRRRDCGSRSTLALARNAISTTLYLKTERHSAAYWFEAF